VADANTGGNGRRIARGPTPPEPGCIVELATGAFVNTFDEGGGPPLVLVHGMPGSAYEWGGLPARLIAAGLRVIRYDRVGYGHSSRRAAGEDPLRANALELAALCDALALDRPVLLGFSYGGAIVQELLVAQPAAARAAVLLAAVGPRCPRPAVPGRAQQRAIRWSFTSGVGSLSLAKQLGTPLFGGDPPADWVDTTRALLSLPGAVGTMLAEASRLDPAGLRPETIDLPALVIHGMADRSVPFAVGFDLMSRMPRSEFCEIPRACHMLAFTEAEAVAASVSEFAGRLDAAA
jgi:pimeloyl-ACP methyl ester carboxylesterase